MMSVRATLRHTGLPGHQSRSLSQLYRVTAIHSSEQDDLDHAVDMVRAYDPAGYLPGRLLPERRMQIAYYAVRAFWAETGLRFGTTAKVPPNSTPLEHLQWWQAGVEAVFTDAALGSELDHPTLRLLQSRLRDGCEWNKAHFDNIVKGRMNDLQVKQYERMLDLISHAEQSCGNLSQLVLEAGSMTVDQNPSAHEAARLMGIGHGLTNALRTSIPVISTTGKLIVPAELTVKYGVKSPRYLLSALGQGDAKCVRALEQAVEEIALTARHHLQQARDLRPQVMQEPNGDKALAVLLPGLASDTFLNRLQASGYQLTDRNLRNVGLVEHAQCTAQMIGAYYRRIY